MNRGVQLRLLAIIGMPASGKGEAISFFREKGFQVFSLGDAVREEADARGMEPNAENLAYLANHLREKFGQGVWAERTAKKIEKSNYENIILDGVRGPMELSAIENSFSQKASIIAIHASQRTRHSRIMKRSRSDDTKNPEAIKARDERELGYGLGKLISLAGFMLVNEGSLEELRLAMEQVYIRINREKRS